MAHRIRMAMTGMSQDDIAVAERVLGLIAEALST
jgi:hypothetical protein